MPERRSATPALLCSGLLAIAGPLLASPSAADDTPSPMQTYFDLIHAVSTGRLDLALAQFSQTAVLIAGPRCTEDEPCVGRPILERYLAACRPPACALPLADQRFDGVRLTTRGEAVGGHRLDHGAPRLWGGHVFEFRNGCITSLRVELDPGDAQTAAFIAQRLALGLTATEVR